MGPVALVLEKANTKLGPLKIKSFPNSLAWLLLLPLLEAPFSALYPL